MHHQEPAFQRGSFPRPNDQLCVTIPTVNTHLRITNTLQELNLSIELVTLLDKSRFTEEPSYVVSYSSRYYRRLDIPCRRRICDRVEGSNGSLEDLVVDIDNDTLASASFLGLKVSSLFSKYESLRRQ
jgi:hypothetical protein